MHAMGLSVAAQACNCQNQVPQQHGDLALSILSFLFSLVGLLLDLHTAAKENKHEENQDDSLGLHCVLTCKRHLPSFPTIVVIVHGLKRHFCRMAWLL